MVARTCDESERAFVYWPGTLYEAAMPESTLITNLRMPSHASVLLSHTKTKPGRTIIRMHYATATSSVVECQYHATNGLLRIELISPGDSGCDEDVGFLFLHDHAGQD